MPSEAEYENSENQTSLNEWKEAVGSLAAFATSKGGAVHFGVSPEGKTVGVQLGKNSLENLAKILNDIPILRYSHRFKSMAGSRQPSCMFPSKRAQLSRFGLSGSRTSALDARISLSLVKRLKDL